MAPTNSIGNLTDESPQHLLGHLKIENRPAANRPMNFDAARFAAQQFQSLVSHANYLAVVAINRYHRRLVQQDASVGLINEGVDSSQIDSELVLEKLLDKLHGDGSSSKTGRVQGSKGHFRAATRMPDQRAIVVRGIVLEVTKSESRGVSRGRMTSVR